MSAANAAVAQRFFEEVWNRRRAEVIDEVLGDDSVCFADIGEIRGPGGFKALQFEPFLAAFPDVRVTVEGVVAEGDTVVVRWSGEGTHTGSVMEMAATGRRVRFEGVSWIVVRDGKFHRGWQWSNIPTVLASLRQ
jgi:predicted ester cyclase